VWTNTHRRYFNEPAPENEQEPQSAACVRRPVIARATNETGIRCLLLAKSRFLSIGAFFRD
jgi:hypothetical protein